jgi:PleD family two-component response regulator
MDREDGTCEFSPAELDLIREHFGELGTVLVVDDQKSICTLLEAILEQASYRVVEAENGQVALELLEKGGIDLVLLDVMMPEMDGEETLAQIRQRLSAQYLPVIMATAIGDISSIDRFIRMGAQDYIVKPFDRARLIQKVDDALQVNRDALLATAERSRVKGASDKPSAGAGER